MPLDSAPDASLVPLERAQNHVDAARAHTQTAEHTYPEVLNEYERIRTANPLKSESQALQEAMGSHAEQIVQDASDKHIFDAGEEYVQARSALREAGLGNAANRLVKKDKSINNIKQTRDAITHPEQEDLARLSSDGYSEAAQQASSRIDRTLEEVRNTEVPTDKLAAKENAIRHLEQMQKDLAPLKNGPIKSTDLTVVDVKTATEMQEIHAGSHATAAKNSLEEAGYNFDRHTFPGATEPSLVTPGTVPGSAPLDALEVRRNDLAHHDPKPEHPGALERSQSGDTISGRIPNDATEVNIPPAPKAPLVPEAPIVGAAEAGSKLTPLAEGVGKVAGPIAVVAPAVVEGVQAGHEAYEQGKGPGAIAGATAVGAGKGAADTFTPGLRTGLSNVIDRKKDLTPADRLLNLADEQTAGGTAFGVIATGAAGIMAPPAAAPIALATGIVGTANVGVNVVKAGVKAAGLSGKDQDGGYIYNALSQEEQLKTHYSTKELQAQLKSGQGPVYERFAKQYGEEFDTRQNSPDHGGMTALPKGLSRDQFIKNRIDFAAHEHAGVSDGNATDVERIAPPPALAKAPPTQGNPSAAPIVDTPHPLAALVKPGDHDAAKACVTSTQCDTAQPSTPAFVQAVAKAQQQGGVGAPS